LHKHTAANTQTLRARIVENRSKRNEIQNCLVIAVVESEGEKRDSDGFDSLLERRKGRKEEVATHRQTERIRQKMEWMEGGNRENEAIEVRIVWI